MCLKFPVVIAFRVTDKLFFISQSPRQVGYMYSTKWDHKAWLIPDLISVSLLRATDLFR